MKNFFIVTIEARKYITDSLTLLSTGVYEFDCTGINFYKLYVDGVFGSVKTTPIVLGDALYTNYYNDLTNKLQVRLNASDISDKKNFIINHIIAVTSSLDTYWNIDPDSPSTRQVIFESRIIRTPQFSQSQENILNGFLTLSATTLELDNKDQFFNNFFSPDDSFNEAEVKAWKCTDTLSNRKLVYKGTVSKIDIEDTVKFYTQDFLKRLDKIFYSRSTYERSVAYQVNPFVPENQRDFKIYKVCGRSSSFKYKYVPVTDEGSVKVLDPETMPRAYCTSNDFPVSVTLNRSWGTCCFLNYYLPFEETFTISAVTTFVLGSGASITRVNFSGGGYDSFSIGDTIKIGASKYARVIDVNSTEIYISPYNVGAVVGEVVRLSKLSALILQKDGVDHYLLYGRDYTVTTPSSKNEESVVYIILADDFEANFSIPPLDPVNDTIRFKARANYDHEDFPHGKQILKVLRSEFSDSEINLTSFDDADAELDLKLNYMVPFLDQDFPTKREILEKLLASSFGYIYLDDDLKIAYGVFKKPFPTIEIGDTEIKKMSIAHSVDYDDIYQSILFSHVEFLDVFNIESDQTTYLHKTNKQRDYSHLCDIVSIVKPIDHFKNIAKALSMKRLITQVGLLEVDLRIGDERNIASSKKLGNSECVVLSLDESNKELSARLTQIEEPKGNMKLITNGVSQGNI